MSEEGAKWAEYNEKNPYGRGATTVGGDNIAFSQMRHEAIKAVKERRATPEQIALVHETDQIVRQALDSRD